MANTLCHICKQLVGNGQVANIFTSALFPQHSMHPQVTNVCPIHLKWECSFIHTSGAAVFYNRASNSRKSPLCRQHTLLLKYGSKFAHNFICLNVNLFTRLLLFRKLQTHKIHILHITEGNDRLQFNFLMCIFIQNHCIYI
jgi:hypothetical protein